MIDETKLEEFINRFVADAAATAHAATVVLGDKLGLYKALAAGGPQTSNELAAGTGCHPRLVEEWLNAQAASEYCEYDPTSKRYSLTSEQIECLADEGSPSFLLANMGIVSTLHQDVERVRAAFIGTGTLGWHEHGHELFAEISRSTAVDLSSLLVPEWIPALEGVEDKLRSGARVADVGCGYGAPTIMLAQAYPASTFHGFDYHAESIEAARKAAAEAGVSDRVTFEVSLADEFPGDGYDLICTFDALHDMGDPVGAARHIHESLAHDGTWMVTELNAGDRVEENINVLGRFFYSASSFICVPNALSQGGTRTLGAQAGEAALREVAIEAGFARVRRAADSPFNLVLEICR
jgi:2-polyprenyl-3-methyl-5-hydroxy-6-metoxy-1,4-benzoquinol methylase